MLPANRPVPLPEALPRLSLPLPGGIFTANVSQCDNVSAGKVASGWWVSNKERKQSRMRAVGRVVISMMGEAGTDYGNGGQETERPGAMTPQWPSNRLIVFPSTSETLVFSPNPGSAYFAQLAMGCTNPPLYASFLKNYTCSLINLLM